MTISQKDWDFFYELIKKANNEELEMVYTELVRERRIR